MFWNGSGAITVALQTPPQWSWLPALILGALIGAYAGAHVALAKGNRAIKRIFEALTILVGIKLILDGIAII